MKRIIRFFDVLEDHIRAHLSQYPIIYSLIGGVGVVLFWRGVWHWADEYAFLTPAISVFLGAAILGLTGVLVSAFIGNKIIIAGLRGEKKLEEKTRDEILNEELNLSDIENTLVELKEDMEEMKKDLHHLDSKVND